MTDLYLGQRVRYTNTLHRAAAGWDPKSPGLWRNEWVHYDWADHPQFAKRPRFNGEGIVTGLRTFSNGTVDYREDHIEYKPVQSVPVVVITYNLRRNPVYVRPEDVTPIDPMPEPGDGPEFHADYAAWCRRNPGATL